MNNLIKTDDGNNPDVHQYYHNETLNVPVMTMRNVIYKLTGTSDLSCAITPTWEQVIGLLLLYFRYMTSDMLKWLFPWTRGIEIGQIKKRLESNGHKYILSSHLKGLNVVYSLSQDGLKYFRRLLPEEILRAARIPKSARNIDTDNLWHDTDLRYTFCAYLRLENVAGYRWYTTVKLFSGVTPEEYITGEINNGHGIRKPDALPVKSKADAALFFKDYTILLEQDTGSETPPIIKDKFEKYTSYFSSIDRNAYQVAFVVNYHNKEGKRVLTRMSICNNIRNQMRKSSLITLGDAYDCLSSLLLEAPNSKKVHNMLLLLNDFFSSSGHRSAQISDLYQYVESHKPADIDTESRVKTIKGIFRSVYDDNLHLRILVSKGLSVVVTGDIYKAAYYINPYDSGMMYSMESEIRKGYHKDVIYHLYRKLSSLRNVISLEYNGKTSAIYIVQEISADITGNIVMKEFLSSDLRYSYPVHILLVVADTKDAIKFSAETGCVEKYCDSEDVTILDPTRLVTVRFMKYRDSGEGLGDYFVPKSDGTLVPAEEF